MAGTLRRPVLLELVETLRRLPRLEALHHLLRMATHLRRHHVETVKQFLTHASVCLLRGATHQSVGHVSQWWRGCGLPGHVNEPVSLNTFLRLWVGVR